MTSLVSQLYRLQIWKTQKPVSLAPLGQVDSCKKQFFLALALEIEEKQILGRNRPFLDLLLSLGPLGTASDSEA